MKDFLIIALAVYRGTTLLNKDEGPFAIFSKFRRWVGIRIDVEVETDLETGITTEKIVEYPENEWAKMVSCPYCLSGYIALIVLLTLKVLRPFWLWLGIWGLVDIVLTLTNDRR